MNRHARAPWWGRLPGPGWRVLLGALAACALSCTSAGPGGDAGDAEPSDVALPAPDVADAAVTPPPFTVTIDTWPRIDGSTSTLPLHRVLACELLGLPYRWESGQGPEGEAEIVPVATTPAQRLLADAILARVVHSRTHQAYLNLVDGAADVILVANTPSSDERDYALQHGVTLEWRPIALDAIVFLDNAANSVAGLSADQVRRIFLGQLTRWSQVGGADAAIHPYVRPANSGSQQLMESIVMGGQALPTWPEDRQIAFMGALLDQIRADPLAVGYSVFYFVTYQYPTENVRVLAIDAVSATSASIASRAYPFVAEVWAVTRADLDRASLAARMRDWLLTADGQAIVRRSGYVPVPSR